MEIASKYLKAWSGILMYACLLMFSCAQKAVLQQQSTSADINVKARLADIDNLGRIYVVDEKNTIINFRPDFTEMYRYANNRKGQVSSVDLTNPLKVVVFYDDFNHLKIFDNTLTLISELDLGDKFADLTAAAASNDGNLWIYDPVQFKIMKISESGNILMETTNVNDFGMNQIKVTSMKEKNNVLVLCDPSKGFYFFDNLGQYLFHYAAKNIVHFQFDGDNITYYTDEGLYSFSLKTKEKYTWDISEAKQSVGLKYIMVHDGSLFLVKHFGIQKMKIN
jgi:hypothetical protein